jgi:SAM-dependent methyltransferase
MVTPVDKFGLISERERVPCPLCSEDDADALFVARDRLVGLPGEFPVVRCRRCGLVYLNLRPTPTALAGYYPDEYYPIDQRRETPEAIAVARGLLRRVRTATRGRSLRILDVGCGAGLFLKFARDAGHEVLGIEPSEAPARYGRQVYGLPIETGTLETVDLPADAFDVVVMWHVLEHLPDPVETLRTVRRILKPGGLLLLGVPNVASLEASVFGRRWFSLDAPRHLTHFTPDTAGAVVERAGFALDRIENSSGAVGLVYSLMGDLTGVSLRLRNRELTPKTYRRIASALSWLVWPVCVAAAKAGRGGAIEVYASKQSG